MKSENLTTLQKNTKIIKNKNKKKNPNDLIMETRSRSRRRQTGDPCNCLRPLIRFWGLVTAIGEKIVYYLYI